MSGNPKLGIGLHLVPQSGLRPVTLDRLRAAVARVKAQRAALVPEAATAAQKPRKGHLAKRGLR